MQTVQIRSGAVRQIICFNITLFVQCIIFSFKGSYLLGKRKKNERSTKKTM